jgi:hypothetical protein
MVGQDTINFIGYVHDSRFADAVGEAMKEVTQI